MAWNSESGTQHRHQRHEMSLLQFQRTVLGRTYTILAVSRRNEYSKEKTRDTIRNSIQIL